MRSRGKVICRRPAAPEPVFSLCGSGDWDLQEDLPAPELSQDHRAYLLLAAGESMAPPAASPGSSQPGTASTGAELPSSPSRAAGKSPGAAACGNVTVLSSGGTTAGVGHSRGGSSRGGGALLLPLLLPLPLTLPLQPSCFLL